MELAARKIMVTEVAKHMLLRSGVEPTPEGIYFKLCELQEAEIRADRRPAIKELYIEAFRAAIHDQLHEMEIA